MPQAKHSPMVIAAARELCKRAAGTMRLDFEPWWESSRDAYIADAQAAFDAAGVGELVEALNDLVVVIKAAGLANLSNGVQLGQTAWFVKASDAMTSAKSALTRATGA